MIIPKIWLLIIVILVGGFDRPEKYKSQWEGLSHIYILENKRMFQTTNQYKNG